MRSIMLCYNLKGTKKGRKIGMLGSFLGFRVKYEEMTDFEEEMIVMLLADNQTLDKLLFQMRKEKVQIPLKAIVTAKNQNWTSTALYKEVKREHESMTKAEQAGKKKEE